MKPKLILLDIFSYSCMNCLRSLNFIKKINHKYKRFGLETVMIHTPEWGFEKNAKNILPILEKYKIRFPVIIDKNKKIVKKFKTNFWPTQILVKDGKILYKHIGEGNYKNLEARIIRILKIKSKKIFGEEPSYTKFPTLYCGKRKNGKVSKLKHRLRFGIIYVDGLFIKKDEFLQLKNGSITILTKGRIVNFVAQSLIKKSIKISIKLKNKIIKKMTINKSRLYNILNLRKNKQQKLTLITKHNLAIYSFSFQ